LWLNQNVIIDVAPLAGLNNLTWLTLENNSIVDATPVLNMPNEWRSILFGTVNFRNNPAYHRFSYDDIKNYVLINGVLHCFSTTELTLSSVGSSRTGSGSGIGKAQIEQIRYLTNLTSLTLPYNRLECLAFLSYLTCLTFLDLSYNDIYDLTPLSSLTNLKDLILSGNRDVVDLTPLANLPNLRVLGLRDTNVTDVTPLVGTGLERLDMSRNWGTRRTDITSITSLYNLTSLTWLNLQEHSITDITPLAGLTNLTTLHLSRNQITDITPLAGLTNLTRLNLNSNHITDITALANLTNLEDLSLGHNRSGNRRLVDITPLANLSNLQSVYLRNNSVRNWDAVSHVQTVHGRPTRYNPSNPFQ